MDESRSVDSVLPVDALNPVIVEVAQVAVGVAENDGFFVFIMDA